MKRNIKQSIVDRNYGKAIGIIKRTHKIAINPLAPNELRGDAVKVLAGICQYYDVKNGMNMFDGEKFNS